MSSNPYAAPTTHVADVAEAGPEGKFLPDGRTRPAGNGWAWIKSGRALTKPQGWLWAGIFIVFVLISVVLSAIPIVNFVAGYFISPILMGGIMLACHSAYKGNKAAFGHLFAGFTNQLWKLLGIGLANIVMFIGILAVVAAIAGIVLSATGMELFRDDPSMRALGTVVAVLVVLALSIPIVMALWFSYALVMINGMGVIDALRTSLRGCRKNIVAFLVYGVMAMLLFILACIPLGLGLLIFGPVMFASVYTSYRDIFYEN